VKLSEAIRLGSMLKPQAFETFFDGTGTCALGAACEAMGLVPDRWTLDALRAANDLLDLVTVTLLRGVPCPACPVDTKGTNLIPHLNDEHRWTREQIADFVETIEVAQERKESVTA
jgi:hypothetical protein